MTNDSFELEEGGLIRIRNIREKVRILREPIQRVIITSSRPGIEKRIKVTRQTPSELLVEGAYDWFTNFLYRVGFVKPQQLNVDYNKSAITIKSSFLIGSRSTIDGKGVSGESSVVDIYVP